MHGEELPAQRVIIAGDENAHTTVIAEPVCNVWPFPPLRSPPVLPHIFFARLEGFRSSGGTIVNTHAPSSRWSSYTAPFPSWDRIALHSELLCSDNCRGRSSLPSFSLRFLPFLNQSNKVHAKSTSDSKKAVKNQNPGITRSFTRRVGPGRTTEVTCMARALANQDMATCVSFASSIEVVRFVCCTHLIHEERRSCWSVETRLEMIVGMR